MRRTIEREEGREEAVAACSSEGLPPFWRSLHRDDGHMVMLGGRALAGGGGPNLFRPGRGGTCASRLMGTTAAVRNFTCPLSDFQTKMWRNFHCSVAVRHVINDLLL